MKYRIKPSLKLKPIARKYLWRRIFGGPLLPNGWKRSQCYTKVSAEELDVIMTRVYDMRREGYSA